MAYEIIAQNNTTTTLSDGVNVIRVPARVTLATSTSYTITKVNNNTATLEDGNGNIFKDIPCVAVLYGGGSGSALPDQTGQSGKFLTTDGTDASWGNALSNWAKGTGSFVIGYDSDYVYDRAGYVRNTVINGYSNYSTESVAVGYGAGVQGYITGAVSVGKSSITSSSYSISIGFQANTTAQYAIQLGYNSTNSDANTVKIANANGNFEIMSADGTIPTARLTKVNSTITLTAAGWSSNTQTVNVTGMTATGVVMVSPVPADQSAYTTAGILCTAQAEGALTFTCSTTPSADIDVNVVML